MPFSLKEKSTGRLLEFKDCAALGEDHAKIFIRRFLEYSKNWKAKEFVEFGNLDLVLEIVLYIKDKKPASDYYAIMRDINALQKRIVGEISESGSKRAGYVHTLVDFVRRDLGVREFAIEDSGTGERINFKQAVRLGMADEFIFQITRRIVQTKNSFLDLDINAASSEIMAYIKDKPADWLSAAELAFMDEMKRFGDRMDAAKAMKPREKQTPKFDSVGYEKYRLAWVAEFPKRKDEPGFDYLAFARECISRSRS
jgi:hypothetical protein